MTAPFPPAPPTGRVRRLFVRDLMLEAEIGVHAHETGRRQRVRLNLDLDVDDTDPPAADDIDRVVSYEPLVKAARALVAEGHIRLVETLAERLASRCLEDPRVRLVRVRVEKLDVFPDAGSVGVEIERSQSARPAPQSSV